MHGGRRVGPRILVAFILILLSHGTALSGQVAGRWRIIVRDGHAATLGELRLALDGKTLSGSLDLADAGNDPRPLTGRVLEDDALEWSVPGARYSRFTGRYLEDSLVGEAFTTTGEGRPWMAARLADSVEFYATLPRFTQRQLIVRYGAGDSVQRLPGAWLRAATERGHTPESVLERYHSLARASGLAPLGRRDLGTHAVLRAMGLYQRRSMVAAHRTVLEAIERRLATDSARVRFAFLFHPGGHWQVDIHDLALASARRQLPGLEWDSAVGALTVAGLLPASAGRSMGDAVPLALYRLFVLSHSDASRYEAAAQLMRHGDPASFRAVQALLAGYESAGPWYEAVVRFLMTEPWGAGSPSLADRVRIAWHAVDAPLPDIRSHLFGYAEGAPVVGAFAELADRLIVLANPSADRWLERHGNEGLRRVVQQIGRADSAAATVELGAVSYQLSSIGRESARTHGGFLEARDAVLIDPSTMPLFAIGTVLHEWHHIVHGHTRWGPHGAARALLGGDRVLTLYQPDVYLAEGLAEYSAGQLLRELESAHPLLAFGEAEKLAEMATVRPLDPHLVGYLMMATLADALPDFDGVRQLVLRWDVDAFALIRDPAIASHLPDAPDLRDVAIGPRRAPVLIPEVSFTVDDGQARADETRYIVPPGRPWAKPGGVEANP